MEYILIGMKPDRSITISSRGKKEVRILEERGTYTIVRYMDLKTGRMIEGKFKIYLKSGDKLRGFLMIPLKDKGKYLSIEDSDVKRDAYVYNLERDDEEPIFID